MSSGRKLGLRDAYSVKTPEDNIRLYADWAPTYESEFIVEQGYVGYLRVVEQLAAHLADRTARIIDVGCGTGVCGAALSRSGFRSIHGIDISEAMLAKAAEKRTADDRPVYRELSRVDLTLPIDMPDNSYGGLVSAGTFTHGHLGAEPFAELWRIVAPGGICSIGINARHYKEAGFAEKIADDDERGVITVIDEIEIDTYLTPQSDVSEGNDKARVLVCQVTPHADSIQS